MHIMPIILGAAILLGAGCSSAPDSDTQNESAYKSDAARFQKANLELVELLRELADRGVDTRELQSRIGKTTYKSVRDMKGAADDMEQIVKDAKELLAGYL